MTDETKKTAQVFRLVKGGDMRQKVLKDLGPTGGNNPGDAIQPNTFEPEDEYQQLYVGATRDQGIIQPPFNLRHLDRLSQENNTLEATSARSAVISALSEAIKSATSAGISIPPLIQIRRFLSPKLANTNQITRRRGLLDSPRLGSYYLRMAI